MKDKKVKILIVDDHPVFRAGIKLALDFIENIKIIGETGDGEEAISLTHRLIPDVILLDISINTKSGLQVAKELLVKHPNIKIIFLTMHKEEDILNSAFSIGASAYLLKDDAMDEISNAIEAVLKGKRYVSTSLGSYQISDETNDSNTDLLKIDTLTTKEREILKLIGEAKTSQEIAEQLHCSNRTIDNHRTHICSKLNLSGNNALVKFAITHRLLL